MEKRYFNEVIKDSFVFEPGNDLDETWKTIASEIVKENEEEREAKISEFIKLIQADPQVAKWKGPEEKSSRFEDKQCMIKFLRAGLWNVKTAMHILRLEKVWAQKLISVSDYRDYYGRRIFFYNPGAWNPDDIPVNELFAASHLIYDMLAQEEKTQIAGVTMVCDLAGFGFNQMRSHGMEQIRCLTSFMSGAFPIWVHKIHVCNNPGLFSVLYSMMTPLLDDRVKGNIIFHGYDYTMLHKEIPPFLLSESLGGTGELDNDLSLQTVKEKNDFYVDMIKCWTAGADIH
ncbi:alpha-tocopherol transfer protein isoform X2 [Eurytemora carolleeae]|uniref:alpha-tocopherol transfer protein isoform X2 n=1 Tax=Eurytemora carolleeae TaxID=1294199 RepID=UPI000C7897F7|nr:alpha-tocopherol transfer protein isoform X2 [Eurytemora carolleeae]|eukprot:XP_023340744.1 alpha-tocopherol transfer protein-like isoform X2 [Eurytemora affinis]